VSSMPEKKQRLGFLKRKNALKTPQIDALDLFAKGWPTMDDLLKFEKKLCAELVKVEQDAEDLDDDAYEVTRPDYVALMGLFIELELSIMRQLNISRSKHLGIAGRFLEYISQALRDSPNDAPNRLAKYAEKYIQLAKEKDVSIDTIAEFLEKLSTIFVGFICHVNVPRSFYNHLMQFISTIISAMYQPLQDGLGEWASGEDNDLRATAPTHSFEQTLHGISDAFANKSDIGMPIFYAAIKQTLGSIDSPKKAIVMLSVLSAVSTGCEQFIIDNLESFMTTYILPFWKSSQDPTYLVPLLYYISNVFSAVHVERLQTEYVTTIIPALLDMTNHENHRVKCEVANFVTSYCENLEDTETLVPYLSHLLDVLYGYLSCPNSSVRTEAITAIGALLMTCKTSFAKHKDRMMTEFKKMLSGTADDRQSSIQALARIGAGIGEHKVSLEDDIEALYAQIVEDCKRDRMAHLDMLLKMTEFGVVVLGPKFSKFMPYVFPLVLEHARMAVDEVNPQLNNQQNIAEGPDQMELDENEGDDEEMNDAPKPTLSEQALSRKESALGALAKMVVYFDREMFLQIHEEIAAALQATIINFRRNTDEQVKFVWNIYVEYIKKLFVKGDPEWISTQRMGNAWRNCSNRLIDSLSDTEDITLRSHYVYHATRILKHLCSVSTPEQPFLTKQVMDFLTRATVGNILAQYYLAEAEDLPFDELHGYGSETVEFIEAICESNVDKQLFWSFADVVLRSSMNVFEQTGPDVYRWFDVCMICTIFDYFGTDFLEGDRIQYLELVFACRDIRTKEMYQCIANHIGVTARKYPMLVTNVDVLFSYLETLLFGDTCQREAGPGAYDNALMALSSLLLHLARKDDRKPEALHRLIMFMSALTSALPPAANGDIVEAKICLEQYCHALQATQLFFEGDAVASLKSDVIRALKETMEMKEYNTPELRAIVDPLLAQLQS
jgi:type III secretion system FlhB-like substrate exporter